jgi:hypothetical protein
VAGALGQVRGDAMSSLLEETSVAKQSLAARCNVVCAVMVAPFNSVLLPAGGWL